MVLLGWVVIGIGILFLLLSIASVVTTVLKALLGTLRQGAAGRVELESGNSPAPTESP